MTIVRQWTMGAIVAVLVVVAGGWFFFISPQKSHASSINNQAAAQEQTNAGLRDDVKTLSVEQQAVPTEEGRIAAVAVEIPETPGLPGYIRDLTDTAKNTGIDLVSVSVATPAAVAAPAAPAAASPASTASPAASAAPTHAATTGAVPLQDISLDLNATGSYYQIQQFVAQIEKFKRASLVSSISLAPGSALKPESGPAPAANSSAQPDAGPSPAAATPASWTTLNATITVHIFMTSPDAFPIPAAPATAGATVAPSAAPSPSAGASH